MDSHKLLVGFLVHDSGPHARGEILRMHTHPEELEIDGHELYIYFPNGVGRSKLQWPAIEKTLKTPGTGRNWNTVTKLLEIAERLDTERQ